MKFRYLMISLSFALFLGDGRLAQADARTLFAPYLGDTPPEVVEVVDKKSDGGIEVTRLRFLSRTLSDGEKVIIYGILAKPTGAGPFPGILVCHGGGADADHVEPSVRDWAKRGYIAFCQDEPGIGKAPKSTGPWSQWEMWKGKPDPTSTQLYDGIVAALNGFNLLRSQPEVDAARIGVTGGSWGGYLTLMVSGLKGNRVKAAFGVYGAGFYDKGTVFQSALSRDLNDREREEWLENFDAGRVARNVTADYFLALAACDWFFWPTAAQASYDEIPSPKNIAYSPNSSHALTFPGGNKGSTPVDARVHRAKQEIDWMEYHLKAMGSPFPVCQIKDGPKRDGGGIRVGFTVKSPVPITNASVWYSEGETPWRTRNWKKAETRAVGGDLYEATIPVQEPDYPVDWFGLATDSRAISTSTVMNRVMPSDIGFRLDERKIVPWIAEMRDDGQWSAAQDGPDLKPGGKFSFLPGAFDGKPAIGITGNYALDCMGLRGVSLARDKTAGLSLWVRSPGGTGFTLQVFAEGVNAAYKCWRAGVENPGESWKEIRIPWESFKTASNTSGPMLSESTAKIRFLIPEGANIEIGAVSSY